jgi:hypothetical protein
MRTRRAKWLLALVATLTNLGGGPMAWAHLAAARHCHESAPVVVSASPDCPQHHASQGKDTNSIPHTLPCCADGSCACGSPPAVPASLAFVPKTCEIVISTADSNLIEAASLFIDDALRPPIV